MVSSQRITRTVDSVILVGGASRGHATRSPRFNVLIRTGQACLYERGWVQIVLLLVSALRHSQSTEANRAAREAAAAESCDTSAPQSPSQEPTAPVFARLLRTAAVSPALCRRWENSELYSLAFQTLSSCSGLTMEHASTLLQVCTASTLPAQGQRDRASLWM
jgi:hypothetical protein